MSNRVFSLFFPVLVVVCTALGLLGLVTPGDPVPTSQQPAVKTVVFHAEQGAFYNTDGKANPKLRVVEGTKVTFVVKNTEPGVRHSITVPGKMDRTLLMKEDETVRFTLQFNKPGTYEYVCPHHLPVMKGKLIVTSSSSTSS